MAQLEYFTFGENCSHRFEKKKCTLSINEDTKALVIQPVDEDIAPISASFDCLFYQLNNYLYTFDIASDNDLVIIFQNNDVCSQVLSIVESHKGEVVFDEHYFLNTRFLEPFCDRYKAEKDSFDAALVEEIFHTFGLDEEEMFNDMEQDQEVESDEADSSNAPLLQCNTYGFDQHSDESADEPLPPDSVNNSQATEFHMQLRKRPSNPTIDVPKNKKSYVNGPKPNLVTLNPSTYVITQSITGVPRIIMFTSTDKKMCYEYACHYTLGRSYYCLGCLGSSPKICTRLILTQENDGSHNVQADESKKHRCQPRVFKESMIVKVPHKDDDIKPHQVSHSIDDEDAEYVVRNRNFKLETSKEMSNGMLIIFALNGFQYQYHYDSEKKMFLCSSCNNCFKVQLTAKWCVDILGEEYLVLGENKMDHKCSGQKKV